MTDNKSEEKKTQKKLILVESTRVQDGTYFMNRSGCFRLRVDLRGTGGSGEASIIGRLGNSASGALGELPSTCWFGGSTTISFGSPEDLNSSSNSGMVWGTDSSSDFINCLRLRIKLLSPTCTP